MHPTARSTQKCHLLFQVGKFIETESRLIGSVLVARLTGRMGITVEPGGGSRGPYRPADRGPNCVMPCLQAPMPSLCPFLYPSGHAERSPSCPDPKHGCSPPQFHWGKQWNLPPKSPDVAVPRFNSPVLGQAVSPNPHPSLLPGLLLPPTLPPQDSPRDLPKGQTRHCSFLLRAIHGSPLPLKSRLLTTTFSSLQGFGPSGSPLSTSCPHPHPVDCGPTR